MRCELLKGHRKENIFHDIPAANRLPCGYRAKVGRQLVKKDISTHCQQKSLSFLFLQERRHGKTKGGGPSGYKKEGTCASETTLECI